MNNKTLIHIILLFIGINIHSFAFVNDSTMVVIDSIRVDSLKIDTELINARHFKNLKETYNDDDFVYERSIENSGWWTRFKQWLSDFFMSLFDINSAAQASKVTDISLKIAGVIIFLLVIYFIFKAVINKEGSWVFGKSSDKSIIPVIDIETNLQATHFEQLIAKSEKEGHYRLAIRYYYLWLLKVLTNAEIIDYNVEKTNSDYYNEINNKATKEDFAYTSYLYNYIWYGEFDVNKVQFQKAKEVFLNFLNSIKA